MATKDPAKLKKVSVNLPFGMGGAEWESDPTERRAAWSLYVELVTRVAVQELELDQGSVREALTSLHSLFGTTRQILREAGPDVGVSKKSVGGLAIAVLNRGIRPYLAKWHPLLKHWEEKRPPGLSSREHELAWQYEASLRGEMSVLREELALYAEALEAIAGVSR